jgi:hypothetical protein
VSVEGTGYPSKENFPLHKGKGELVRFKAKNGAGASRMDFHMAANRDALAAAHDLNLSTVNPPGGITMTPDEGDPTLLLVDVLFTKEKTAALPRSGPRFYQLVMTKPGQDPKVVVEGVVTVFASLGAA